MADVLTFQQRKKCMSRIRCKNTKPELKIRKELHRRGFRYRLHIRALPGCPDIVLTKCKTAIQVRGCFWHKHGCRYYVEPKTRPEFWISKLNGNKERDKKNDSALKKLGWKVIVVWECRCRTQKGLEREISRIERLANQDK